MSTWQYDPEHLNAASVRRLRRNIKDASSQWEDLDRDRLKAHRSVQNIVKKPRYQELNLAYVNRLANADPSTYEQNVDDFLEDLENGLVSAIYAIETHEEDRYSALQDLKRLSENAHRALMKTRAIGRIQIGSTRTELIDLKVKQFNEEDSLKELSALLENLLESGEKITPDELLERAYWAYIGGENKLDIRIRHPSMGNHDLIPVDELAQKSGGENLTLIIILFCVLMRARRGSDKDKTFPLILDNPLGSANRADLVKLQVDYARSLGIQLIYSTGIKDENSIAMLRKHIRMRKLHLEGRTGRLIVGVDRSDRSPLLSMTFFRKLTSQAPSPRPDGQQALP